MPPRTPPPTQPDLPNRQQVIAEDNSTYCPPEESSHHTVGAPSQIPAGEAGGEDKNPGPWAEYAMTVPWKVARNARKLKTRAIAKLKQATAVREPLQRSTTHYTGKRLDERIGSKAANVESILIQIVGEVSQQECTNCLQNDGPWAKCVRYHDIDRVVTACGNCQWNGRAVRCDFFQLPLVPETSRGHRRNRFPQSSMEAIHNAIMAENFAELVVPARAFIPTTTADDHQAQFNRVLSMINSVKEQLVNIQRT